MNTPSHAPPTLGDLPRIAVCAAQSVPATSSARRWQARLAAAAIVPLCLAASFLGTAATVAAAFVIALALFVRLVALAHVLRDKRPPGHPAPDRLPRVSVLLPLREEQAIVVALVTAIRRLDYPAELVEVIALVEEDDPATLAALRAHAPAEWRLVVVPEGRPQTKPRACNVGLALARGEVIVVFDGEDRPEPDQARKAVAALAADERCAAVQARLGCDHAHPGSHPLAAFWALEYAVLFGAIQPALALARQPFLLGGSSNWFRTRALRAAGGWDAHNVTEDADLAVRLARAGWSSSVIDSTTWEEAPIRLGQWVRQRSRWLQGFALTTAVHFLRPRRAVRELGVAGTLAIVAQLPATLVCSAAHPVGLWLIFGGQASGTLAVLAAAGYSVSIALHLAVARRDGRPIWLAILMPAYWLLQTVALIFAAVDLMHAPTRWRKTPHGLADRPHDGHSLVETLAQDVSDLPLDAANASQQPAAARRK